MNNYKKVTSKRLFLKCSNQPHPADIVSLLKKSPEMQKMGGGAVPINLSNSFKQLSKKNARLAIQHAVGVRAQWGVHTWHHIQIETVSCPRKRKEKSRTHGRLVALDEDRLLRLVLHPGSGWGHVVRLSAALRASSATNIHNIYVKIYTYFQSRCLNYRFLSSASETL